MRLKLRSVRSDISIVHHLSSRGCFATCGRTVMRADSPESEWRPVTSFPGSWPADFVAHGRLPRRLLRSDKCNVHPTRSGALLGIRGGFTYSLDPDGRQPPRRLFAINGDCVMNRAIAEDDDGSLYFGEYFMNPQRVAARIWKLSADLAQHEVVQHVAAPRARHIHAVHRDPYLEERLWVTMGDFEGECFLGFTDDRFENVEYLGDGGQNWRTVGMLFEPDRIGWLTDTHIEQNRVVTMDRDTQQIELHGTRTASSWYAATTTDGLRLFTTTVEPGPGIQTQAVHLVGSPNSIDWQELVSFQKDRYPMRGFGFGSLSLPSGEFSSSSFWISGEGVTGLDGCSALCAIEPGLEEASR